MPTVRFAYPNANGHLAVSRPTFQAYCAEHKLELQQALHLAIKGYFDGLRDDEGRLFPRAAWRAVSESIAPGREPFNALCEALGVELPSYPAVPLDDFIEVEFPERPEPGRLTLSTFLRRCRYVDESPEQLIRRAVWQLVFKRHERGE